MEVELFTLFKNYHDKSLYKFKKELLDDFINFFNTTKNGENKNYISNTKTHICGYKRSQNRGSCKRLCRDIACSYHIKHLSSHKSDVYDIHEVDISTKNKNQTSQLERNIDLKLLNYNDDNLKEYDKILPPWYKKNNKKCILLDYKYFLKSGKSDKYDISEICNNTQTNNLVLDDQFLDNSTQFCLPNIYDYYINNFKYSSSVRKNTNCNINIDFSKEVDIKLKTIFFNNKKINNKKKIKKRYLQEYKLICNIYDIIYRSNNYDDKDYISFVNICFNYDKNDTKDIIKKKNIRIFN